MPQQQRILSFDILRVWACLMVVAMHSPMAQSAEGQGLFLNVISYFSAPCIGLFFMVSGALLLPVSEKEDTFSFIRKRLSKVLAPALSWTVFYLMVKSDFSLHSWASIPFSAQGHGVLWFMYVLIGLYLLAPVWSAWLRQATEKEIRFYLCLWAISLCYPILEAEVTINESPTGILYYFSGYAGYFLLGYYLHRFGSQFQMKWVLVAAIGAVLAPLGVKMTGISVDFYRVFWYLSVFVAILCVACWKVVHGVVSKIVFPSWLQRTFILISNLSFGIYLSHIFIMRWWLWKWDWIANLSSYYLQTGVVFVLTFCLSLGVSWIISLLPGSQYIIGFHKK